MHTNRTFDIPQWAYALVTLLVLAGAVLLPRDLAGPAVFGLLALSGAVGGSVVVRRWVAWAAPRTAAHVSLRWAAYVLAAVAGGLLAPGWGRTYWPFAVGLVLLASALAAPTLAVKPCPLAAAAALPRPRPWHGIALVVSLALLLLVGLLGTDRFGDGVTWPGAHAQFALLWVAIGGVVIGLGAVTRFPTLSRPSRSGWAVIALAVVGLALRLVLLGSHMQYMPDEWIFASAISRFAPHVSITEPVGIYAASTWVFVYWQHALSALVGGGLFGLRVTSAVIGALTIAATGWLAHELFDRHSTPPHAVIPLAVTSAAVLACFPAHIHYSRLALYNIVDPLVGVAAAALLARAFRTGERASYVLGGTLLGLSQYFYEAGRLLFIPLFGLWILAALLEDRARWRGLLLTVIAAVMIGVLPWFPSFFDDETGVLRLRTGSVLYDDDVNPLRFVVGNIDNALLMLTTTPDIPVVPYYGGEQGLVPVMWLPFFVIGGVVLLARPLRLNHLLPLLWVGGTVAGAALLREQSTPRFAIVLPLLALLCALGLNAVIAALARWNRLARITLVAILAALTVGGTVHYFVRHIPAMNLHWAVLMFQNGGYSWEDLAYRMANVPDGNYVVVIADRHSLAVEGRVFRELLTYFNPTVQPIHYRTDDDLELELWLLSGTDDITFFIHGTDADTLRLIERYFVLAPPQQSPIFFEADVGLVQFDVVRRVNAERPPFPGSS